MTLSDDRLQHILNDELSLLRRLVLAFDERDESGAREKFYVFSTSGGSVIQHRALSQDQIDETLLDDLQYKGLIEVDYSGSGSTRIVSPSARGRELIGQLEAAFPASIDVDGLAAAVAKAAAASDPLAWDHGLAVLRAVDAWWRENGYSVQGVPVAAMVAELEEADQGLATALVRGLISGNYLDVNTDLGAVDLPGLAVLTDRARGALGGWPSQDPQVVAQALISAIDAAVAHEVDPVKKRRLSALGQALRELGVATASEVVAKVVTAGG